MYNEVGFIIEGDLVCINVITSVIITGIVIVSRCGISGDEGMCRPRLVWSTVEYGRMLVGAENVGDRRWVILGVLMAQAVVDILVTVDDVVGCGVTQRTMFVIGGSTV